MMVILVTLRSAEKMQRMTTFPVTPARRAESVYPGSGFTVTRAFVLTFVPLKIVGTESLFVLFGGGSDERSIISICSRHTSTSASLGCMAMYRARLAAASEDCFRCQRAKLLVISA